MNRRDFVKACIFFTSIAALSASSACTRRIISDSPQNSLKHVEIHLVEHCNLNCKYCSHFSCIAPEEFYDVSEYERDMAQLAKITNSKIDVIQLLGGEPLLHPHINFILDITRKYMPDVSIDLLTNGLLLDSKSEDFWLSLNKNNIYLTPSIYPVKINWPSIFKKAKKYNVNIKSDSDGKLISLSDVDKYTIHSFAKLNIDANGSQELNRPCDLREYCANFIHGKLYQCFVSSNIKFFNKKFNQNIPVKSDDYIDIYKAKNIDELIAFMKKPTPFCKYCKGYYGGGYWESIPEHTIDEWLM